MEHTIIIWKKLKERNSKGNFNYSIETRYSLNEEDICREETEKWNEGVDPEDEYEYYAEIELTSH